MAKKNVRATKAASAATPKALKKKSAAKARAAAAAAERATAAAAAKKPHPLLDGGPGRFRVLPGTLGWATGTKVEGKLASATRLTLSPLAVSGSYIGVDRVFPLDEHALMMLEVAAVWRATHATSMRAAYAAWDKSRPKAST